ncbi:unnamed protein product [marine sediment metagenome]|uniref:Uncharacterized protein n=1 Tax=marine sediment metagenome TaxID=412755 RepID=X1HI98_9ZZZZ
MSWIMPTIEKVWAVMEVVAFIQFIEEEAIQSAALGAFLAIRQRNYKCAWKAIDLLDKELIPHLDQVNREIGWVSPYSFGCFRDFIRASQLNVEIYKDLCTAASKR